MIEGPDRAMYMKAHMGKLCAGSASTSLQANKFPSRGWSIVIALSKLSDVQVEEMRVKPKPVGRHRASSANVASTGRWNSISCNCKRVRVIRWIWN